MATVRRADSSSLWEHESPSKKLAFQTPDFGPCDPAHYRPDFSATEQAPHFELAVAIDPAAARKLPPAAPKRRQKLSEEASFLVTKAREIRNFIVEKAVTGEAFNLVIPNQGTFVVSSAKNIGNGEHSDAYLCTLNDGKKWVLKVFRDEILTQTPNLVVECAAGSLYRYCQNRNHDFMKHHTAQHLNLDSHVEEATKFLGQDEFKVENSLRAYVKDKPDLAFLFVKYVPTAFPVLDDDRRKVRKEALTHSVAWQREKAWVQLRQMFAVEGIHNDTRRSNVRIDENGDAVLIDIFERSDPKAIEIKELKRSFTGLEFAQDWICPIIEKATSEAAFSDDDW